MSASPESRHVPGAGLPSALRAAVCMTLVAFLVGAGLYVVLSPVGSAARGLQSVYRQTKVPPAPRLARTSFVYDRNGKLLAVLHGGVNRIPVSLGRIPKSLQRAVIAAEDSNFY